MVIKALLSAEVEIYHDFILIRPERLFYGVNTYSAKRKGDL
jgi:hypothetical protein